MLFANMHFFAIQNNNCMPLNQFELLERTEIKDNRNA